ncbi:MAG TPA: CBS domain-containing protein [Leptolyngbyaceae cyanobacterium M65_K2018_010]|nr:CBS domain-containing protein [Leptolyngbyaceae cyanobacterium M65_K2018_010]
MLKVADIMTREVVTIRNSAPVAEAAKLMQQRRVQALIVERSHDLDAYGIVTVADVVGRVIAFGRNPRRMRVYEIMTKPCIVLNPDLGVEYAARLLTESRLHSAPVIQTELLGILSITDILERSSAMDQPQELEFTARLQELSARARQICQQQGPGSAACAEAWAQVDAIQAEIAHQRAESLEKTAFESFCDEFPEALRDRDYDTWCSG